MNISICCYSQLINANEIIKGKFVCDSSKCLSEDTNLFYCKRCTLYYSYCNVCLEKIKYNHAQKIFTKLYELIDTLEQKEEVTELLESLEQLYCPQKIDLI